MNYHKDQQVAIKNLNIVVSDSFYFLLPKDYFIGVMEKAII
jgi:hypothetical protein